MHAPVLLLFCGPEFFVKANKTVRSFNDFIEVGNEKNINPVFNIKVQLNSFINILRLSVFVNPNFYYFSSYQSFITVVVMQELQ